MKPTFSHNLMNSFILWFDNFLLKKADAYKTYTTNFYNYTDERLGGGKVVYGSPFKQWVYDKSITGATVPSGVYVNNVFVPTGTSGMLFDYDNGRIIFNSGVPTNLNISGTYSVKELNTYITNEPEDRLIIENKYEPNSRFTVSQSYIPPYKPVTPAVFCSMEGVTNDPFAYGGEDQTTSRIKAVLLCDSLYQLDGALSVFSDSLYTVFSQIPMTSHPIAEFGSVKTGLFPTGYSFDALDTSYNSQRFFITEARSSKIRDNLQKELNPTTYIGFVDFEVKIFRYPRI